MFLIKREFSFLECPHYFLFQTAYPYKNKDMSFSVSVSIADPSNLISSILFPSLKKDFDVLYRHVKIPI